MRRIYKMGKFNPNDDEKVFINLNRISRKNTSTWDDSDINILIDNFLLLNLNLTNYTFSQKKEIVLMLERLKQHKLSFMFNGKEINVLKDETIRVYMSEHLIDRITDVLFDENVENRIQDLKLQDPVGCNRKVF